MPEAIIDYLDADYGIVGEGESLFNELILRIERGERRIRSFETGDNSHVDMNGSRPLWKGEMVHSYGERAAR